MKKKNSAGKYFFILLSIALLIWVVFEYLDYTRFDAPVDYNYNVNEEIDYNYHDQSVVKEYLKRMILILSVNRLHDTLIVRILIPPYLRVGKHHESTHAFFPLGSLLMTVSTCVVQ